jgi:hypothetical protein
LFAAHAFSNMTTGQRCEIFDRIAALSGSRTVADLVARLQPILRELAYYAVNGEAAVLETHEEWRTELGDALAAEQPPPAPPAPARPRYADHRAPPPRGPPAGRREPTPRTEPHYPPAPAYFSATYDSSDRHVAPDRHAAPDRHFAPERHGTSDRRGAIPDRLRQIMEGRHESQMPESLGREFGD